MKKIAIFMIMMLTLTLIISGGKSSYAAEILRIISWDGNFPDDKMREFEEYVSKKYDETITVERQYAADERDFFDAIRGQTADVALATHNLIKDQRYNYIKNKIVLPVNLDNVPNYSTIIPAFKDMETHVENGAVYCIPIGAGPYGLYYNADIIRREPKSWRIFWDKQYAGQYAVSYENYENNIYITIMGLGGDMRRKESINIKNLMTDEYASRLNALAGNADHLFEVYEKADQIKNLAFSTGWGAALAELNNMGKNWKVANPSEGVMGWVDGYMIGYSLSQNDNKRDYKLLKKVAEEWLNFNISPKFQLDVMVRFWSAFPTNLSVKPLLTPQEAAALHLDDPSYFEKNFILFPTLTKRQRNGMNRLWNNALRNRWK